MCGLQTKNDQVCATCPLCGTEAETETHCLIHCLFAKTCWNTVCPEFIYDGEMNIKSWFEYVLEHLSDKAALIGTVCWGIWKARNDVVWNKKSPRAGSVVNIANAYLTQWQRVQELGAASPTIPVTTTGDDVERWLKPQRNSVKVNCDATVFKQVEEEGRRLGRERQQVSLVESYCQLVVRAITNRMPVYSPFGGTIDECRWLLASLNNINIVFVKRSGNIAADWLARSSSSNPGCIAIGGYVPSELQIILEADLL